MNLIPSKAQNEFPTHESNDNDHSIFLESTYFDSVMSIDEIMIMCGGTS